MSLIRSRWAAIGAAVAITLGGGGIGLVSATTSSGERTVLTTLDQPCRIAALRPAPFTVGPRPTPLAANETYTINAHGTTGDCTLPSDAVALALNVTALNASQNTNLRFWAAGSPQPATANLNPAPGQPPAPNAVTTGLSDDGKFSVYNFQGDVQIVIDVLGYYTDHNHDDRYYTKTQVDTRTPQTQVLTVGSSAFSPKTSTIEYSKTVSTGGAWETGGTGVHGLVAPLQLPDGAEISAVSAQFWDNSTTEDLKLYLYCELSDGFSPWFTATTTSASTSWRTISLTTTQPRTVDPACAFHVQAFNANWDEVTDDLRIKDFRVEIVLSE